MPEFITHPTPNPNSFKLTTEAGPFIESGLAAFNSPEEAEGHPLGERLFSVEGVVNVLILPDFLTVTKHPAANWDVVMEKVEHVLQDHFEARTG